MPDEKCPNCLSGEYDVDNYWDDFDEDGGIRVWECICSSCHKKFDITYEYKCIKTTVEIEVSAS